MNRGYVKLWRKTLDSGLLQNGPAWQLFGYLMLRATHRPHRQIVGGIIFDLQPGQMLFSRARAAAELHLGERQIRTAFSLLEKLEILTSRATNKCTVVSLVNWQRYNGERPANDQQNDHLADQQTTSTRPADDQQSPPVSLDNKKERIKNYNIYTASATPDAEPSLSASPERTGSPPESRKIRRESGKPPDGPCYRARSGRYLTGVELEAFTRFWADFAYARGKAEAADAWLDIADRSPETVAHICHAARCEAAARSELEAKGQTPKWAQGWLSARRWEDYAPRAPVGAVAPEPWELSPEEIDRRRKISLEQARAWRAAHGREAP